MRHELEQLLTEVLPELGLDGFHVVVTATADPTHGDYATNIAFQAAKILKISPMEAADKICSALKLKTGESFKKIEIAKPGFINFFLSQKALLKSLDRDTQEVASEHFKGKKIMIEFTDPNPFKEFHIGHLYSNIVGESISRLIERAGGEVRRVCYQGDVGLHVAKAIWGLSQQIANGIWKIAEFDQKSLKGKAKALGEAYALGAAAYEEDPHAKEEIIEINKKVYASISSAQVSEDNKMVSELYLKGRQWSLDYFESIYERLGTEFLHLYFESDAGVIGLELVKKNKDVFKESQGAVVFPGEDYGLHTRVFINSLGLPTYEAKELGLAVTKYQDYPFDLSIMITGNEINEYFKVLLKALSLIKPEIASKMKHLSHGMVRLPEGKMSSRTGNVITGEWLLDEAVARAKSLEQRIDKRGETSSSRLNSRGITSKNEDVAEVVGVGAVKWALLRSGIGKDIEFSFEESVSFEGNSGPYLQYTYVRTKSILEKSKTKNQKSKIDVSLSEARGTALEFEERQILVYLSRYNEIISEAAESFSPNIVTTYLFELAQLFNLFYQKYPILKADEDLKNFRLALTRSVGIIFKEGLHVLGIQAPERM